jgi:hypothetical protein
MLLGRFFRLSCKQRQGVSQLSLGTSNGIYSVTPEETILPSKRLDSNHLEHLGFSEISHEWKSPDAQGSPGST